MADKTFLDIEEVNALLPSNLKIQTTNPLEKGIYRTETGKLLPVLNSKYYDSSNGFWYSSTTSYYKTLGVEEICFTAGLLGIFVVPIDLIWEYNKTSGWKGESKKKGRQYHVRIRHLRLANYNDYSQNKDLSSYFVPNGILGLNFANQIPERKQPRKKRITKKYSSKLPNEEFNFDDEEFDFDF